MRWLGAVLDRIVVPTAAVTTICLVDNLPAGMGVVLCLLCVLDHRLARLGRSSG